MLLDEIDEMVAYIKDTYAEMETMYAKYLPYFPIQGGIIDGLNQQLNTLNGNPDSVPRHDKEPGKELMNQKDMLSIADDIRRYRESQKVNAPVKDMTKMQYTLRVLFRKINQLCHPDKTKRFNRITVVKLRECFDDAQKAYEARDYDTLELTLIRVCYYRDELDKLNQADVKRITEQYQNLQLDIKGLRMHRLYTVLYCHGQQQYSQATQHFGIFLQEYVEKLNAMIIQLTEVDDTLDDLAAAVEEARQRAEEDEEIANDYDRWVAGDDDPELTEYRSVGNDKDDE